MHAATQVKVCILLSSRTERGRFALRSESLVEIVVVSPSHAHLNFQQPLHPRHRFGNVTLQTLSDPNGGDRREAFSDSHQNV